MKVEVLEKSPVEKSVSIEVGPETYEKYLDRVMKKVSQEVSFPGFRRGRAPKAVIMRKIGVDALKKDMLDELIPEVSAAALEEKDLMPLSTPVCSNYDAISFEMGKPISFELSFEVKPQFEMAEYKGLELVKVKQDIDQKELLEKQITNAQQQAAEIVPAGEDRELREGDVAHLDFESFREDGTPVQGGSAVNYYMTLDSKSFIPGFMDNVVGRKTGDSWEFEVTFPENYPDRNIAGQKVKFAMQLHGVMKKEVPVRDDDFAKSVSKFKTYAEYEADVEKRIGDYIDQQYRYQLQEQAMKQLLERMKDLQVPSSLVRGHQERFLKNLENILSRQGKTLSDHLTEIEKSMPEFLQMMEPQATEAARGELILDKIGDMEKVEVSPEEVDAEIRKVAENLSQEFEMVKKAMERDKYISVLKYEVLNRKIFDVLINNANITEKTAAEMQAESAVAVKEPENAAPPAGEAEKAGETADAE